MSTSDSKDVVPVNSLPTSNSTWPARLRNGSGEKLKNWAAILMGIAALVTAIGTYYKPTEDPKYKIAYKQVKKEITEISVDIRKMSTDIKRLYQLRQEEDRRRLVAAQLESSAYEIEDQVLRRELERRYGRTFVNEYMKKRKKHRMEIRQEYVESLRHRNLPNPHLFQKRRELPNYGKEKDD